MNPNLHVYSTYKIELKIIHELDIGVNTSKVKYKQDEEPLVTYIESIKVPGYFEIFECGKQLFINLDVTYEGAFMASAKENCWSEFHHIITNYNGQNDTPLSNIDIREAINQLMLLGSRFS